MEAARDGAVVEPTNSSPLLERNALLRESPSPRVARSEGSFYRLPTFPRNVSICTLAGGASEEESKAHKRIQQKLLAALVLAFIFMIVEVVGGIMAHSLAIITDAAHLLSDVSGFAVAALAAYWAKRRSHEHFSYGYHRVEVLGALASVMTVWLVTGILLFEAVQRIITPEEVNGKLMFIIAMVGVGVNIVMMLILGHHHHGHGGHSHGGGHSHAGHDHSHGHDHAHGNGCSGHGHSHSHNHSHSHSHGNGGACGGGGKPCGRGPHSPVLEAAELSRSSVCSLGVEGCTAAGSHEHGEGQGGEHRHRHVHAHAHEHAHSHGEAAAAAAGGRDLEAAEEGHAHSHPHSHSHAHAHHHHNEGEGHAGHVHGPGCRHSHDSEHSHGHSHSAGVGSPREGGAAAAVDVWEEDSGYTSGGLTPILKQGHEGSSCQGHGLSHGEHEHGAHGGEHGVHSHAHGGACNGGGSGAAAAAGGAVAAPAPAGNGRGALGGGCSHDHANMNMRGAIIHVIGDFVQSIGVAIAGALIWWHQGDPSWYIADPICTFLFAGLVLWTTRAILRDIGDVLMERVPRGLCIKTIHDDLSRVAGVEEVHDLHVWSLTPGIPLMCAHVNLSPDADATAVLCAVNDYCRGLGIEHSTVQLVMNGSACPCACTD